MPPRAVRIACKVVVLAESGHAHSSNPDSSITGCDDLGYAAIRCWFCNQVRCGPIAYTIITAFCERQKKKRARGPCKIGWSLRCG